MGQRGRKEEEDIPNERKLDSCGFEALLIRFHGGELNPLDANITLLTLTQSDGGRGDISG